MFTFLLDITIDITKEAQNQGLAAKGDLTNSFGDYISSIMQAVMAIALVSVLIFLLWGAVEWIFAGGEKSKVEAARGKITGAIMGLLLLVCTVAIFTLLQQFTGIKVLSFPGSAGDSAMPTFSNQYLMPGKGPVLPGR